MWVHARLRRAARPGLSGLSLYTPVPARSASLTPCGAVVGWTWGVPLRTCCGARRRRQLARDIPPCSSRCALSSCVIFMRNGAGQPSRSGHLRLRDNRNNSAPAWQTNFTPAPTPPRFPPPAPARARRVLRTTRGARALRRRGVSHAAETWHSGKVPRRSLRRRAAGLPGSACGGSGRRGGLLQSGRRQLLLPRAGVRSARPLEQRAAHVAGRALRALYCRSHWPCACTARLARHAARA